MANKQEAIHIAESFIQKSDTYATYVVDADRIIEYDFFWYVPFKDMEPERGVLLAGAYNGVLIDKKTSEYFQPGSGLSLDDWIYGYEHGLIGRRCDLIIEKVYDYRDAVEMLWKLNLTYVRIEVEAGTTWKTPRKFSRKEIKRRLDKPPCTFKNQGFTYAIDKFRRIREEKLFAYRLVKTENTDPAILGELIEE